MMIDLTAGRLADLDDVLAVSDAAFDPRFGEAWSAAQLRGTLTQPGSWLRLAMSDRVALGFSLCRPLVDEAELLLIAVHPDARGNGVGRALLTSAVNDAGDRGMSSVFLEMRDGNAAAQALYRAVGFAEVGRRRDYYRGAEGQRFDAITMRRQVHA